MALISAILWVAGLILSVVLAPQLRLWTWGPAMLCFSLSALVALPLIWKERKNMGDLVIVTSGFLLVSWLGIRATLTPIQELGQSDLLLVSMAVATFVSFRGIASSLPAQRVVFFGIAALTTASLYVIARQISQPSYSPVFPSARGFPSGFYAHYSYGASYLIAVSMILFGLALHGRERLAIRLLLATIAALALVGVYFTKSRGAYLGALGGLGVLFTFTLILAKREKKKWFAPAILTIPFLVGALGYALFTGWSNIEQARGGSDVSGLLDNAIRFYLASIALSCFLLHPIIGGGARSYSWESYQFWDYSAMGQGRFKPEHVHNELLQTATDYGIIGAGLLVIFLISITVIIIYRTSSRQTTSAPPRLADGWRLGGIAGFAALFIHSNFEGIFRIAPGAVLLAICLSAACFPSTLSPRSGGNSPIAWFRSGLISSAGIVSAILLFSFGLKGTRVSLILWPSFFGNANAGKETQLDALSKAIPIWPLFTLYRERAEISQRLAIGEISPETAAEFIQLSLADFQKVTQLHPHDPAAYVSSANILSGLGRYLEAEASFTKAIKLQGEMEAAFQANFQAALHHQRKALREFDAENPVDSLSDMQIATRYVEQAFTISWIYGNERDQKLRIAIHQNYGKLLETIGEPRKALESFDFVVASPHGLSSNYLAALLYGRLAVDAWFEKRKPEDALYLFRKANERMNLARDQLPPGATPAQREEHSTYFKNSIATLESGAITASENVDF